MGVLIAFETYWLRNTEYSKKNESDIQTAKNRQASINCPASPALCSPVSLSLATPTLLVQEPPWHEEEEAAGPPDAAQSEPTGFLSIPDPSSMLSFGGTGSTDDFYAAFGQEPPKVEKPPGEFHDFSLLRVLLGYGIPSILAVGLATWCFCRRDL